MRQRKCKDCGCDISSRYIKAQRCCDCAVKRQQRLANRRRRQARKAGASETRPYQARRAAKW